MLSVKLDLCDNPVRGWWINVKTNVRQEDKEELKKRWTKGYITVGRNLAAFGLEVAEKACERFDLALPWRGLRQCTWANIMPLRLKNARKWAGKNCTGASLA
jgi:hypothetical protein